METGLASWYGEERDGNLTANGEVFDMNGLTAAHRALPMGTKVKVTNVKNRRSATLRINDRGPGIDGRLIDVSMAAARGLGFLNSGLAPVQVEVVSLPKPRR
jgi:rare lipoprotein A